MLEDVCHALVIGGTGMLRGVCMYLASRGGVVSVLARDRRRLDTLAHETRGAVRAIAADYRDSAALRLRIEEAVRAHGPIGLAVCWIHSTAPEAPLVVARAVAPIETPCRFFHILGSASADPSKERAEHPQLRLLPGILYRRIVLGFVIEPAGSRWLTNDEIGRGVIEAVAADRDESIIGVGAPWSARP